MYKITSLVYVKLKYCFHDIFIFCSLLYFPFILWGVDDSIKLPTYLLIGQSNMVGWGNYEKLNEECRLVEKNEKVLYLNNRSKIENISPNRRIGGKYKVNGSFGPEYSFATGIAKEYPESSILIIKYAVGGTSLYAAWNKKWEFSKAQEVKEDALEVKQV